MTDPTKNGNFDSIAELEPRDIVPFIILGILALFFGLANAADGTWLAAIPLFAVAAAEMAGAAWVRRGRSRFRLLATAANGIVAAVLITGSTIFDAGGWTWTRMAMISFSLAAVVYAVREIARFRLRSALDTGQVTASEATAELARGDRIRIPVMACLGLVAVLVILPQSRLFARVRDIFDGPGQPNPPTTVVRESPVLIKRTLDERDVRRLQEHLQVDGAAPIPAEALADSVLAITPETFYEFLANHTGRITIPTSGGPVLIDDLPLNEEQSRHLYLMGKAAGERPRSSQEKDRK